MYGHQQCVEWHHSLSIMIIFNVLYLEFGRCCNTHNCFAFAGSYLTLSPSFVTGDEWSQRDYKEAYAWVQTVCQMIELIYIDHPFMSCIQEKVIAAMSTIILLLDHVHI
jgi:hypothetical protein